MKNKQEVGDRIFDSEMKSFVFNLEKELPPNSSYRDFDLKKDLVIGNKVCAVTKMNKVRIGVITNIKYIDGICLVDDVMTKVNDIKLLFL
jgi:hypothetical protein